MVTLQQPKAHPACGPGSSLGLLGFIECTIRDFCASGPAVRLAASTPGNFELRIARDGSTPTARTIRKDGNRRSLCLRSHFPQESKFADLVRVEMVKGRPLRFEAFP